MMKVLLTDMSNIGAHGSRRFGNLKGVFARVFAGRMAHAGSEQASKAVPARLGRRLVPSNCRTQLLKNLSKLESSRVGSPIKSISAVRRGMGLPDLKFAIQVYSHPPNNRFETFPALVKNLLPLPKGS